MFGYPHRGDRCLCCWSLDCLVELRLCPDRRHTAWTLLSVALNNNQKHPTSLRCWRKRSCSTLVRLPVSSNPYHDTTSLFDLFDVYVTPYSAIIYIWRWTLLATHVQLPFVFKTVKFKYMHSLVMLSLRKKYDISHFKRKIIFWPFSKHFLPNAEWEFALAYIPHWWWKGFGAFIGFRCLRF